MQYKFFATCGKGIEEVLTKELKALRVDNIKTSTGGVYFSGDITTCYKANLWLRSASRVLMELSSFKADTPEKLYGQTKRIPWGELFRINQTFAVFANVRDSKITHSGFTALKVKDAIADTFRMFYGSRPNIDSKDPDVKIFVRLLNDECSINIDTSGDSLHKRGYRTDKNEAPLRETLAAAILLLAGYDGSTPLVDFMCGSGTLPIEAGMIAKNIAPGLKRKNFGFLRLLSYNKRAWLKVITDAETRVRSAAQYPIYASDISKKNIEITKSNARRAEIRDSITITRSDLKNTTKKTTSGIVVINSPYGERLDAVGDEKLEELYEAIGDTLKTKYTGYDAYIFTGNLEMIKKVGLKATTKHSLFNGPIDCRLVKYELYKGSATLPS